MMEKNVTKKGFIVAFAKHIHAEAKRLKNECYKTRVGMNFDFVGGIIRNISFGGYTYIIQDKFIDREEFVEIVAEALRQSKAKGKIQTDDCTETILNEDGSTSVLVHKNFSSLMLFGKPCKQFKMLQSILKKYAGYDLDEFSVYSIDVCGKRSSRKAYGEPQYLDFNSEMCEKAITKIRSNRFTKDVVSCGLYLKTQYEGDYERALKTESEWFAKDLSYLNIDIVTPKGKIKYNLKLCSCPVE